MADENKPYDEETDKKQDKKSRRAMHRFLKFLKLRCRNTVEGKKYGFYGYDIIVKNNTLVPKFWEGMVRTTWWDNENYNTDNISNIILSGYKLPDYNFFYIFQRKWKCFNNNNVTRFFLVNDEGWLFRYIDLTREEYDSFPIVKAYFPNNKYGIDSLVIVPEYRWSRIHNLGEYM